MNSVKATNGMVVSPHYLGTQSALKVLRDGGTAMEAAVAGAATLAVVYPHMNSIGGDALWLITPPEGDPFVIEACGAAGSIADKYFFQGLSKIPYRGPKSACTVAGTVGGWKEALNYVSECGYQRVSVHKLLADAISYAENGFPVASSFVAALHKYYSSEGLDSKDFADVFLPNNRIPIGGEILYQKNLANTLKLMANDGLDSFYRGDLAKLIVEDMTTVKMPIVDCDLVNYKAVRRTALRMSLHESKTELFNTPPPTQGLASMAILGILEKLKIYGENEGQFIHTTVEATKQAYKMRDDFITDPKYMKVEPNTLLSDIEIQRMANNIDFNKASGALSNGGEADTVWLGVMDKRGFSVSLIQSVYHGFGSGVVLPKTGILWHNRGCAFSLDRDSLLYVKPGKKPLHTLNTATARLSDGRQMIYGTRGGDGQPQTQAAIFHRYVIQGLPLQKSISNPRWLFGRIAGDEEKKLKIEGRYSQDIVQYLKDRGHSVQVLSDFDETMGQAGALVRHPNGVLEGACDPRGGDGSAAGY